MCNMCICLASKAQPGSPRSAAISAGQLVRLQAPGAHVM